MSLVLLEPITTGYRTEQEARWTLWYLGFLFQVELPTLKWTKARRPRYYGEQAQIRIGPHCWPTVESGLLHEFAHHLT